MFVFPKLHLQNNCLSMQKIILKKQEDYAQILGSLSTLVETARELSFQILQGFIKIYLGGFISTVSIIQNLAGIRLMYNFWKKIYQVRRAIYITFQPSTFFRHHEDFEVWEQVLFEFYRRPYFSDKTVFSAQYSTIFFKISSCFTSCSCLQNLSFPIDVAFKMHNNAANTFFSNPDTDKSQNFHTHC